MTVDQDPASLRSKRIRQALPYLLVLLPVLVLGLIGYIVWQEFIRESALTGRSMIDEAARCPDWEWGPVNVDLGIEPGTQVGTSPQVNYSLVGTRVTDSSFLIDYQPVCVTAVHISRARYQLPTSGGIELIEEEPGYRFESLCPPPDGGADFGSTGHPYIEPEAPLSVAAYSVERLFPFDGGSMPPVFVWLEATDPDGAPVEVRPNVAVISRFQNWSETVEITHVDVTANGRQTPAVRVDVNLRRLKSTRIFVVLLLLVVAFFITMMFFIKKTSTVVEASVAILLGLWGIQNLLIPPEIGTTTLVHICIITLYLYLAAVVFLRLALMPLIDKLRGARDSGNAGTDVADS